MSLESGPMTIQRVSPDDVKVSKFITELDAYLDDMYPAESNHIESTNSLKADDFILFGAFENDDLLGIGGCKLCNGYGEIKRMYVPTSSRNKGIASLILGALERAFISKEVEIFRLETGIHQVEAIRFYRRMGYSPVSPFGSYEHDPLSLFFEKTINFSGTKDISDDEIIVSFSSNLNEGINDQYSKVADVMEKLVECQDGYIGHYSSRSENETGQTFSYWRDSDSIAQWKEHPRHKSAQEEGKKYFYSNFTTNVAKIVY